MHTEHTLQYWQNNLTQHTLKCVDSETGKIAGMALWDVYITPSDWKKGEIGWLQGKERERAEALIGPLWGAREKMWSKERYLYCHVSHLPFNTTGENTLTRTSVNRSPSRLPTQGRWRATGRVWKESCFAGKSANLC